MKIVQIAAEFAPIAKAGGLGEALLGLSRELTLQHQEVDVLIPGYSFIDLPQPTAETVQVQMPWQGRIISNTVRTVVVEGCRLHLIEPDGADLFRRNQIYGYPDDAPRFLYFCRAALEVLAAWGEPIDALHLHDWHTAACAPLLRDVFASKLRVGKVLFTIHNLEYQGHCAPADLDAIGLQGSAYLTPRRLQDANPLYPQSINLLKGGILYADAVTTVSPSYAEEIQHPETGLGLADLLKRKKVRGILNGIDQTLWNPARDPNLKVRYASSDPLTKIRDAKLANLKHLGFPPQNRPFIGAVTRLVPQKGIHLIRKAIEIALELGGSFALLGSSPIPEIQQEFLALKERHKHDPRVFIETSYSDPLAHQIYAALDFILVPSLFEPCGLTQIIAMRYGTIPIVRSTGGLKDTVFDCEDGRVPLARRNGFVFKEPTSEALRAILQRAFSFWHAEEPTRLAMLRRMMEIDCSWKKPTREYLRIYESAFLMNKRLA